MEKQIEPRKIDPLLRIADIQERCQVSRSKAYAMLHEGLPYLKLRGSVRIRESELEKFLERCEVVG